jgi:hypothetical protein
MTCMHSESDARPVCATRGASLWGESCVSAKEGDRQADSEMLSWLLGMGLVCAKGQV